MDERRRRAAPAGTIVVTFPDEITYDNAAEVSALLSSAFTPAATIVIADLSGTTFCDSSALRELVVAYRQAAAASTEFRLVIPPGWVARLLHRTGVASLLAGYPTLDAALAGPLPPATAPTASG
jgi:anti-anti-sigma factor